MSQLTADERFWAKVMESPDGCWLWTGAVSRGSGSSSYYGRFRDEQRITVRAHRWAYESLIAPIPDGLTIDHLCRQTRCVNPWHMEPVPPHVNTTRAAGARPRRTHCSEGHDLGLTGVVRTHRLKCRTCIRAYQREWHRARAVAARAA